MRRPSQRGLWAASGTLLSLIFILGAVRDVLGPTIGLHGAATTLVTAVTVSFLVYKVFVQVSIRRRFRPDEFGRELSWSALAMGVSVGATLATSAVTLSLLPSIGADTRSGILVVMACWLAVAVFLCEGLTEYNRERYEGRNTAGSLVFGFVAYVAAFVLMLARSA